MMRRLKTRLRGLVPYPSFPVILFLIVSCLSCSRSGSEVKNLILLIGDGMGPQEIGLALSYARYSESPALKDRALALEKLMNEGTTGIALTSPEGFLVTDSAASATQIATGKKSRPGMIGLDRDGNRAESILEKARKSGRSAGLVSDTRITHATPAAFAAHRPSRAMESEIALDILDSGAEMLLSGGLRHWLPGGTDGSALKPAGSVGFPVRSARKDGRNLLEEVRSQGYATVFDRASLKESSSPKLLGLFAASEMPDAITVNRTRSHKERTVPTLAEMTEKALQTLSQNKKGFFLMVEGGQIDYAGHSNDAGRLLHEMLVFNEAADVVYRWARGRSDTLVVVIADHATGGFSFSYSRHNPPPAIRLPGAAFKDKEYSARNNYVNPSVLDRLYAQKKSFENIRREFEALDTALQTPERFMRMFNEAVEFKISLSQAAGILELMDAPPGFMFKKERVYKIPRIRDFPEFYTAAMENRSNLMARAVAPEQGVVWSTGGHTASPVLVTAWGPAKHTRSFGGVHHTTDVYRLMAGALGL